MYAIRIQALLVRPTPEWVVGAFVREAAVGHHPTIRLFVPAGSRDATTYQTMEEAKRALVRCGPELAKGISLEIVPHVVAA